MDRGTCWNQQVQYRDRDREGRQQCQKNAGALVKRSCEREGAHLGLHGSALEREHDPRTLLNEENDEDENGNLAKHSAGIGLEEFVCDAERERANESAPQIPDAAEDHNHERIDDVTLTQIG